VCHNFFVNIPQGCIFGSNKIYVVDFPDTAAFRVGIFFPVRPGSADILVSTAGSVFFYHDLFCRQFCAFNQYGPGHHIFDQNDPGLQAHPQPFLISGVLCLFFLPCPTYPNPMGMIPFFQT
jgi:hypothetical protein